MGTTQEVTFLREEILIRREEVNASTLGVAALELGEANFGYLFGLSSL